MHIKKIIVFILVSILFSFQNIELNTNSDVEKIYTQTDRPLYFPGETVWFKSYITTTQNQISTSSEVMYADLISPKGTVVSDVKLAINQGYAYGDFYIQEDWVGGIYKVRMYTNWMRNFGKDCYFEKEIIVQKVISPNLLMTLEFDKKAYGNSAAVIANFEAKNLKNIPLSDREIQFEVTINGKQFLSETTKTDAVGKQDITFSLPNDLQTTDVILNVLVPHKNSRESISRSVPITLNNIDLQFFPESGNAILGVENQIAFKALNEFGKPADVTGDIVDANGEFVKNFKSYHDGMGSFVFTPDSEKYYARITSPFRSDSLISLPKIDAIGTKFSIQKKENTYELAVFSSSHTSLNLVVANAHKELFTKKIKLSNNRTVLRLNETDLSTGIIKISLQENQGTIVAERLLFANKSNRLTIDVSLDKEYYETREKVRVKIKTTDKFNRPVSSNLSVSIVDNKLVSFADDKQDNIHSYLWMSAELKGKIHKPSFYFDPNEDKAELALDYVMQTHGWRKYIQTTLSVEDAVYMPDTKAIQYGRVIDKDNKGIHAKLLLFDQFSDKVLEFETNDAGEFSFKIDKDSDLVLLAYRDDKIKVSILQGEFVQNLAQKNKIVRQDDVQNREIGVEFKTENAQKPINETTKEKITPLVNKKLQLNEDNASLDEIVITSYGIEKKEALSGAVVTLVEDDRISKLGINTIGELLQGRVSGLNVTNNSNIAIRGSRSILGNSQPLLVIDGVPFDQNGKTIRTLNTIETSNIDTVLVLKGAAASSIYGANGINGVILVTTKNQKIKHPYGYKTFRKRQFRNYAVHTFYHRNFTKTDQGKMFYSPVYDTKELSSNRTDFRQTLYWNPVIQTDKNGEATFEYYNSDAITSFIITTEGVSYNALVGRNETKYATKKILNIDFKTPNYMAINDTIQLPMQVTNESKEEIVAQLKIKVPKELEVINSIENDTLRIPPNSFQTRMITVVPVKKSKKAMIQVHVISDNYKDKINRDITIISPYFPTQASVSGLKNDAYEFDVNNVVEGSLKAEFSLYTDIIGNVMDGIESLIREPSGCFEQVSSSTYPNVLIMKYLKETGKSNPKIEKRAMEFIKKGYQKLAAYETSKNGFEWYGETPPHEALSAYGLMEFTEMKDVYEGVSEAMIKRTVNYLSSRKNGKGGFKQNRGKYGFSAAPEHINNAYIIYAISESGINTDIEYEYTYTYNEAINSDDSYRMALMACASYNLGKTENAHLLIDKIKNNIEKYGFQKLPSENTITRSYGNAKEIETAAFSILALLKQGNSEYLVSQGIEFMLSKRKDGRFGSTQSTSMALKALIEYTKTQKQKIIAQDNSIEIRVNEKIIKTDIQTNNEGKLVIKNIEKYLKEGTQYVKVNFSNPEITFPYLLHVTWDSTVPNSSKECKLALETTIHDADYGVGDNLRMNIHVRNKTNKPLPMTIAVIGIPSGTSAQPWQLKEILEQQKADYYEVFDNYLVFYWKELDASEVKEIRLDLKAETPGVYQAPASTVYLYYTDEYKHWIVGDSVTIKQP